jgi:hypothetical protein
MKLYNILKTIITTTKQDFEFMSEQDILDLCKYRCEIFGDKVTMNLYDIY